MYVAGARLRFHLTPHRAVLRASAAVDVAGERRAALADAKILVDCWPVLGGMAMRSLVTPVLVTTLSAGALFLQAGCGDSGGGDTQASAGPATNITGVPDTSSGGSTGGVSGTTTEDPTGGGNSNSGTGTSGTTPPGTSTDTPVTSTDPGTSTDPATSDPSSTTEPGTTTTGVVPGTTTDVDPGTTTTGVMTSMTSTTTGDASSSSDTGDVPCSVVKATLKPVKPNMMLVLDKSGSMINNPNGYWDHDANPGTPKITRWNSLYNVVETVLTKFNAKLNFGASLFPSVFASGDYNANACKVNAVVEIPVAANNKDTILAGIPGPMDISLKGGTPTAAGMTAALKQLKSLPADVPRAVLLVTDGAANCATGAIPPPLFESYDSLVHTIVADAYNKDKIPTYVVGIDTKNVVSMVKMDGDPDNINTFTKLNELAVQGGKPKNDPVEKFYNATNQLELGTALDAIVADALSCVIPLSEEPAKPELTKVVISGVTIPHVMNCGNENGWVYVNPNGPYDAIELCGTACTNLKMVGKADVNFFCVPN